MAGCAAGESQPANWRNARAKTVSVQPVPGYLNEISGLAAHDDLLWAINDSGNAPNLYRIDGGQIDVIKLDARNHDWEALASDSTSLYVMDCGNNWGTRRWFQFYQLPWQGLMQQAEPVTVKARRFRFADTQPVMGLNHHNQDCEAATVVNGRLWVFSKDWLDLETRLYVVDPNRDQQAVEPRLTLPVDGLVTGANYNPQNGQLALVGYVLHKAAAASFIWLIPVKHDQPQWKQAKGYWLSPTAQWEGIVWYHDHIYVSTERSILGPARIAQVSFEKPLFEGE